MIDLARAETIARRWLESPDSVTDEELAYAFGALLGLVDLFRKTRRSDA